MKKILIVILIIILAGLAFFGYLVGIPSLIKGYFTEEGKVCGGWQIGKQPYICKPGFECKNELNIMDASGVCVKVK